MAVTYLTRCKSCQRVAPPLGKKGCMGLPTASRIIRNEELAYPFGTHYEGLAAIHLVAPEMDRYLAFLQKHRRHRMELVCSDPDLNETVPPWKPGEEPRYGGIGPRRYAIGHYAVECEVCGARFASEESARRRRFPEGSVGPERIEAFLEDPWVTHEIDFTNGAGPLGLQDFNRLGKFLLRHRDHTVRVSILPTRRQRTAFLAATARRRPRSAEPVLDPNEWWKRLEQSGWCDEVGEAETTRIRKALAALGEDLSAAALTLSAAGFDAECIENSGDYTRWVISAYRDASAGAFQPTKAKDTLRGDPTVARISFQAGGKTFSTEFGQDGDYVADGVHDFMNAVLEELGERRRFHMLPTGDQTALLVCVTPQTFERTRQLGLVPRRG